MAGIALPAIAVASCLRSNSFGFYWGCLTTAARGTILLYTAPFLRRPGAHFLLGERLIMGSGWGCAAFGGVTLVIAGKSPGAGHGSTIAGDLLCLGGGMAWAATTLLIRGTVLRHEQAERALLYQLVISAILLLGVSLLMGADLGEPGIFAATRATWLALAYQILVVASFGYLSWFVLIQRHSPARLSSFTFLTPLFGVLFAALLGAAALCAAGLWLINRR